ncbi:MAG: hypothetical protein Phog2KO_22010 [Phototrophicaceae bacterium]
MPLKEFNEQEELEAIQRRYEIIQKSCHITLSRLNRNKRFNKVVSKLKDQGWKDWHILLAIHNGVVNWHVEKQGFNTNASTARRYTEQLNKRLYEKGEQSGDRKVPLNIFTLDNMKFWLSMAIRHYLFGMKGAVSRPRPYSDESLKTIVSKKYKYFELDVPHDSIFDQS